VVFEGRHFVTSPNMKHIYAPPRSKRMTFKTDYRLGEHDQLLWPQPYLEPQCHLACIPRSVEVFEESARPVFKILFHQVGFSDFWPLAGGPISGLGFLSGEKIASLKKLGNFLQTQFDTLDPKIAVSTPILSDLLVFIKRTLVSLEGLPMTKRQALFLFAEIQRYMLEYSAGYRYLTIYKPRMLNLPASTSVEHLVGAFVFNLADADNFVRAGIPVWLVRPAALAGTVRVQKLVGLIEPRDKLCLVDAYDTYPVCYEGSPVNMDRYKVFARYSATFLSYQNPFHHSEASTALTSVVRVFAPQPSPQQAGPRPGSSGVDRRQTLLSSSRHTPCMCQLHFMLLIINTSLDLRNHSQKAPGSGGRNKFDEPSSPFLPLAIAAWRDALKNVVVNPTTNASLNQGDRGYAFPDPGLFFGVTTPEGQAKFFYNWLKYRPALIYRLAGHNSNAKPLSTQDWRTMLHLPIPGLEVPPRPHPTSSSTLPKKPSAGGPEQTKSAKRLEVIRSLLRDCLDVDGVHVNETPTNGMMWQEQRLSPGELPDQRVAQEILWELFELNFRFEFMALDLRAHIPLAVPTNGFSREDLLLKCFPGNVGGSFLVAPTEFAHQGLAASTWQDRAPFIVAVKNVVCTWSGFDEVKKCCSAVDLVENKDVECYSESEIEAMELAMATFYTQTFYDFFGRAAVIPRRLAPKPVSQ
jgi:hypothetical protein